MWQITRGKKFSSFYVWGKALKRRHLCLGHEGKAQIYGPNI
jgi:hypothetical protein